MKKKKLKFIAHESKPKVSGLLCLPDNPTALIVLGHGAGAGMTHKNMESISASLVERGLGTFRYQFPFMERGGGRDSQEVSTSTVASAVSEARQLCPTLPIFSAGHSFGGRMTSHAAAAGMIEEAVGLIFFAFPLHPPGKPSVERAAHLSEINQPMLFLSGTRDKLFTTDLFEPIHKKLKRRMKLHLLDTADHGYKILKRSRTSQEDVFGEMARVAENWITKQMK